MNNMVFRSAFYLVSFCMHKQSISTGIITTSLIKYNVICLLVRFDAVCCVCCVGGLQSCLF